MVVAGAGGRVATSEAGDGAAWAVADVAGSGAAGDEDGGAWKFRTRLAEVDEADGRTPPGRRGIGRGVVEGWGGVLAEGAVVAGAGGVEAEAVEGARRRGGASEGAGEGLAGGAAGGVTGAL